MNFWFKRHVLDKDHLKTKPDSSISGRNDSTICKSNSTSDQNDIVLIMNEEIPVNSESTSNKAEEHEMLPDSLKSIQIFKEEIRSCKVRNDDTKISIQPLPLPPSFVSNNSSKEDEDDHMFVRGVPKKGSTNNHLFSKIVSRFNSVELCENNITKIEICEENSFTNESGRRLKFSNLKSSMFRQAVDNDDESEENLKIRNVPWITTNRRIKFRISSLSRDVPIEAPNLHKGFIVNETFRSFDEKKSKTYGIL